MRLPAPFVSRRVLAMALVLAVFFGVQVLQRVGGWLGSSGSPAPVERGTEPSSVPAPVPSADGRGSSSESLIERAFAERRSDVLVTVPGKVSRVLADDLKGSRHQRFILELAGGHTVLVAHNIDLADRVPLRRGDSVEVRGEYEWNQRGGVIHWTHHDPQGRHQDGWIRHRGRTYG